MCIWHQRCDSPVWGGGGGRAQEKNLTEKLGFFLKALKDFLCHIYIYISFDYVECAKIALRAPIYSTLSLVSGMFVSQLVEN